MRRRKIANLMRRCSRLSQEHQQAMTELGSLLDDEYGEDAYDRLEAHEDGDTHVVEPLNYGGDVPPMATLDRMFAEMRAAEEDEQ